MRKKFNNIAFLIAILSLSLITGCMNIDYIGQHYPATPKRSSINFYNNSKEVPDGQYAIIGRAVAAAPDSYSSEEIKNALIDKAQTCGADAIQVVDFKRVLVSQQAIPQASTYDNSPVGSWGNRGTRANGSKIKVNSSGKVVGLQAKTHNRYELKARVLFLRLKTKTIVAEPIVKAVSKPKTTPKPVLPTEQKSTGKDNKPSVK